MTEFYDKWKNTAKDNIFSQDIDVIKDLSRELSTFPIVVIKELMHEIILSFENIDKDLSTKQRVTFIRNFSAINSAAITRASMINLDIVDDMFTDIITSISNGDNLRDGYVYLLKCDFAIKIGMSIHQDKRTNTLKTQAPFPTERIYIKHIAGYDRCEKYLHEKYKAKRLNGEWFALSEDEIAKVIKDIEFWDKCNGDYDKIKLLNNPVVIFNKPDAEKCLDVIMGYQVDLNTPDGRFKQTIAMWVEDYYNKNDEDRGCSHIPRHLAGYGIKVNNDNTIDIAASFDCLKKILKETSWDTTYGKLLRRHKDVVKAAPKTARFNGSGKGIIRIKFDDCPF